MLVSLIFLLWVSGERAAAILPLVLLLHGGEGEGEGSLFPSDTTKHGSIQMTVWSQGKVGNPCG